MLMFGRRCSTPLSAIEIQIIAEINILWRHTVNPLHTQPSRRLHLTKSLPKERVQACLNASIVHKASVKIDGHGGELSCAY